MPYLAAGLILVLAPYALGQETIEPQDRPPHNQNTSAEIDKKPAEQAPVVPQGTSPPVVRAEPASGDHHGESQNGPSAQSQQPPGAAENFGIWGVWGDTPAQWIMAVFGTIATGISIWAVYLLKKTLQATRDAASEAARASNAAADTVTIMQRAERAYVTLSHRPPGLDLQTHKGFAAFKIETKNNGRTPARILDTHLEIARLQPQTTPPNDPVYDLKIGINTMGGFLVANSDSTATVIMRVPDQIEGSRLWLFGFVDYVDIFGTYHRGGYARFYHPPLDDLSLPPSKRNNLIFGDRPNWNYDRPLTEDEKASQYS